MIKENQKLLNRLNVISDAVLTFLILPACGSLRRGFIGYRSMMIAPPVKF